MFSSLKAVFHLEKNMFKTLFFTRVVNKCRNFCKLFDWLFEDCDGKCLGIFRLLFGICMIVDTFEERGLSNIEDKFDRKWCKYPLLDHHVFPNSLDASVSIYGFLLIGSVGITLGVLWPLTCGLHTICYWYIFLSDATVWNNHSYLFGLFSTLLLFSDANSTFSLDNVFGRVKNPGSVPRWNYLIVRGQIFLVYFYAGVKKIDQDWLNGYSMGGLGSHWVFYAFKIVASEEQIEKYVVHLGGFLLDLCVGFLLIFRPTRYFGIFLCVVFNTMNSFMFSIGMFPYVMLIANIVFLTHCSKSAWSKCMTMVAMLLYALFQLLWPFVSPTFLPGLNIWKEKGLYGYSWTMMLHNWDEQRVNIILKRPHHDAQMFLNWEKFARNRRWTKNPRFVHQFAQCLKRKLHQEYNVTDAQLFVDVWVSLNGRFVQRMYNPTTNMFEAEWSFFQPTSWVLPLATNFNQWRNTLITERDNFESDSTFAEFVLDFPNFSAKRYVASDKLCYLKLLHGRVEISEMNSKIILGKHGDKILLRNAFHEVRVLGKQPACYAYYIVTNTRNDTTMENPIKSNTFLEKNFNLRRHIDLWKSGLSHIERLVMKIITHVQRQLYFNCNCAFNA